MSAADRQTDRRQTDVRQKHRLMPPPYGGEGIIIFDLEANTAESSKFCWILCSLDKYLNIFEVSPNAATPRRTNFERSKRLSASKSKRTLLSFI